MKKQTKILVILLIAAVGLISAVKVYQLKQGKLSFPDFAPRETAQLDSSSVSPTAIQINNDNSQNVIVDFGNGTKVTDKVLVQNPYLALTDLAKKRGWEIAIKQYKYGLKVEKIDRTANGDGFTWKYFINGKEGVVAADRNTIFPGDEVIWKYTR